MYGITLTIEALVVLSSLNHGQFEAHILACLLVCQIV